MRNLSLNEPTVGYHAALTHTTTITGLSRGIATGTHQDWQGSGPEQAIDLPYLVHYSNPFLNAGTTKPKPGRELLGTARIYVVKARRGRKRIS